MGTCHSCGQTVQSTWSVCPFCTSDLQYYTPEPTYAPPAYEPPQPVYQPAPPAPQPVYQQPIQQVPAPQIQYSPPRTTVVTSTQRRGGGGPLIVIGVIFLILIVLSIVLYAWASALASPYTWNGDIDSRALDAKYYDYVGDWERDNSDGTVEFSNTSFIEELEITSLHADYNWPYVELEYNSDSDDWSTMVIDARMEIVGNVWFMQVESVTLDGEYSQLTEDECFAAVHEDRYYGINSWRGAVTETDWPYWCDSVEGY